MRPVVSTRPIFGVLVLAVALLAGACSSRSEDDVTRDTSATTQSGDSGLLDGGDVSDVDGLDADEPETSGSICGDGTLGDEEECDDGNEDDGDACSNACRLNDDTLCAACERDADCGGGGLCLEIAGGLFCGFDCSESDSYCPGGFECARIEVGSGDEARVIGTQCLPLDRCDPVDECADFPGICGGGDCTDEDVGYTCECFDGYELTEDNSTCVDVDECGMGEGNRCGVGRCQNVEGGYTCECPLPYVSSGGTCAICPPETALSLTLPEPGECTPLAEADHQALLDRAATNFRQVLTRAAESPRFLEISPFVSQFEEQFELFGCEDKEGDCEEGLSFDPIVDFAIQLADGLEQEIFTPENIDSSDACSLTLILPEDLFCDESEPPETCDGPDACADGYTCEEGQCEPASCATHDDCDGDSRCGDDDLCEPDCLFERLPVRVVLWPAGERDVYAEVVFGDSPNTTNPADIRVFDGQLSVVVDLAAVVDTLDLVDAASLKTSDIVPDSVTVDGIVEVDLDELSPGEFRLALNLRRSSGDSAYPGIHLDATEEEWFDSYANETPLPASLDIHQACPFVWLSFDDANDVASVGTGVREVDATIPFALLNGEESCRRVYNCCGNPEGCCTDDGGQTFYPCCTDDDGNRMGCCEEEIPCRCYDEVGDETDCPCVDDDGMPIDCQSSDPVDCPYYEDGEPMDCLPNVGSLHVTLGGQTLHLTLAVTGDDQNTVVIDRLGFGETASEIGRDGLSPDGVDTIVTLAHNATRSNPYSSLRVSIADDAGLIIDLVDELELDLSADLQAIVDRIPDPPEVLEGEVVKALLAGSPPHLRVHLSDSPVRPVELLAGVLTLYSQYLDDTITAETGQCLVESGYEPPEGTDVHPFEMIEAGVCPLAAPVVADATVFQDAATTTFGEDAELSVGSGRITLLAFDLTDLPDSVTEARLELYLDWEDTTDGDISGLFDVFAVTETWSESSVTWNNRPETAVSYAATIAASDLTEDYGFRGIDITDLVNDWLDGTTDNHGVAIVNATSAGYPVFTSRDADESGRHPRLVVVE